MDEHRPQKLWNKSVPALSLAKGCRPPHTLLLSHRAGQRRLDPEAVLRNQTLPSYMALQPMARRFGFEVSWPNKLTRKKRPALSASV
jgi:hypothetical protein